MCHTLTERFVHSAYHHLLFFDLGSWIPTPLWILFSSQGSTESVRPFCHSWRCFHFGNTCLLGFNFSQGSLASQVLMMTFVEVWIYIDCPFSWLLNSLQNYLANSLSWGRYLRYRERTWNELVAKVERICNEPKMILLCASLLGGLFLSAKLLRFPHIKKSKGNFFHAELC